MVAKHCVSVTLFKANLTVGVVGLYGAYTVIFFVNEDAQPPIELVTFRVTGNAEPFAALKVSTGLEVIKLVAVVLPKFQA